MHARTATGLPGPAASRVPCFRSLGCHVAAGASQATLPRIQPPHAPDQASLSLLTAQKGPAQEQAKVKAQHLTPELAVNDSSVTTGLRPSPASARLAQRQRPEACLQAKHGGDNFKVGSLLCTDSMGDGRTRPSAPKARIAGIFENSLEVLWSRLLAAGRQQQASTRRLKQIWGVKAGGSILSITASGSADK